MRSVGIIMRATLSGVAVRPSLASGQGGVVWAPEECQAYYPARLSPLSNDTWSMYSDPSVPPTPAGKQVSFSISGYTKTGGTGSFIGSYAPVPQGRVQRFV